MCRWAPSSPSAKSRASRARCACAPWRRCAEARLACSPTPSPLRPVFLASPTGFPFKVLGLEGTLSEAEVYAARPRRCDLGYLRELYRRPDGTVGYRCSGEPVEDYVRKGGRIEDTRGRKCICNGLLATAGLGQWRADGPEPAIVTSGDELREVAGLLDGERRSYSAADVVAYLTDRPSAEGAGA